MKILKTDKRLIDEGWRYKIEGDLISDDVLDLTDLDKGLYVTGLIKAGKSIKAGTYIEAGTSIKAGGSIKAGEYIEAGGSIKAGASIEAGGSIKAGDDYGITAGLSITAKETISAGLKVFAGVCAWREIDESEMTITCSKLIGGACVAYGILNETGEQKKKVTLELTDEQLDKIKDLLD